MKIFLILIIVFVVIIGGFFRFARTVKDLFYPSYQEGQTTARLQPNEIIHQIWDSGLFPHGEASTTTIYWLDESTLLFVADKDPKPAKPLGNPPRTPWLYLWRLGEKPQPYGADPEEASKFYRAARGSVCFQQKKIDPVTGKTSEVLMVGLPGQEHEAPLWDINRKGQPSNGNNIEPGDCEQFADPAMAGRLFMTDSYRHYYLDRGAYPSGFPLAAGDNPVLMKSDGSFRKILPIPPEEFAYVYFRTFENVFWIMAEPAGSTALRGGPLVSGFAQWKTTDCLAIWRVDPEFRSADRRCIPFGPWSGREGTPAMISLVPTARGLFFTSTNYVYGPPDQAGPSGLYKLENGAPQLVLSGYVQRAASSPSGCRVAFIYGPNWLTHEFGTPGSWTIAVIDLCASGPQQPAG
jgi:hypothetical protein